MEPMQLQLIEIRDQRQKEWFWIDNEFIDKFAREVGPVATLVYISLSRHADNGTQTAFPSMQTIGDEVGIKSRNTIAKGIKTLERHGIIDTKQSIDPSNGKRLNNTYTLLSRKFWKATAGTPKKQKPEVAEKKQTPGAIVDIRHEVPEWVDKQAWADWEKYRRELRKPLTQSTVKAQLKDLEAHKDQHVEMIRQSIKNGWMGLFPLKGGKRGAAESQPKAPEGKYSHVSK